ncbi:glutathione S-transferase Mu 1-like isoform X2 [Hyalella azteca]|uniref:glutathione transferase n=1 Tax=Hyalella azteca TaxID=294128 RepID=A0A8B7N0Y4_HYAAZ|nr:glutathione S-transferase Mu 1-like isoform X2 [Hyalella azteca]
MAPILGYWEIRGLAQYIRYVLAYTGTEYVDKHYTTEWADDKENLGLEFPNLPYYIDGDLKITESGAILRYLARKNNLVGSTEDERIRLDMAEGIIGDAMRSIVVLCYNSDFETKKVDFIANIDNTLKKLSKLVGSNKFILGDKVMVVDFILFETLERYVALVPTCLDSYANLQSFHKRIEDIPSIKKYRSSPEFAKIKEQFNGPMAKFGSVGGGRVAQWLHFRVQGLEL